MQKVRTFKDLVVWQKAFQLCLDVYKATASFPEEERYGLTAELRKTSRSVVYNIGEGHKRGSTREYLRFLGISSGSGGELETQLLLSSALRYLDEDSSAHLLGSYAEVERMLDGLIRSLKAKGTARRPR
jgi:four helix bundle protein